MKKSSRERKLASRHKKILIIIATPIVLLGLIFSLRGWIRVTVAPKTTAVFYMSGTEKVTNDELDKLGDPLNELNYSSSKVIQRGCDLGWAKGYKIAVSCGYGKESYMVLSKIASDKNKLNAGAKLLQDKLKSNGWVGTYSDNELTNSLTKLISKLTSGDDAQPNASYMKKIGSVWCSFDTNVASSSPKPIAMASRFLCYRTIQPLGDPLASQTY